MGLTLSDEQEQLAKAVAGMLADIASRDHVRAALDSPDGFDRPAWTRACTELGLVGLAVPEELGGSGGTFADAAVALEESGRALLPGPLLSSIVAADLLTTAGGDVAKRCLPSILDGSAVVVMAVAEGSGSWSTVTSTATRGADGAWRLDGTKSFVIDGCAADALLVAAQVDASVGVFVVDAAAPGVTRTALRSLDPTRRLAHITFDAVLAEPVGSIEAGLVERAYEVAVVALACELVGVAQRCLDMSVDYAKLREQFGRPIGSFQAIKHALADVAVAVESARSAARHAAVVLDAADGAQRSMAASVAVRTAIDAAVLAAQQNVQVHGGIGYTWEHDAHLYLKRARASAALLGTADDHGERIFTLAGAAQ